MNTDIKNDLARNDCGEKDIDIGYERLRALHKTKVLPYYELMRSRTHGDLRYMVVELNDKLGTILITDLITQKEYILTDEPNQLNVS